MFDNLRDQASGAPTFGDEGALEPISAVEEPRPAPSRAGGRLLGMTASQRLVIAVLLMLAVCVVGAMCLLVTGRIGAF